MDTYHQLKEPGARRSQATKPKRSFPAGAGTGLFYVAPARTASCAACGSRRLLTPAARGLADLAERSAAATDVTTRANLQIREFEPAHAPAWSRPSRIWACPPRLRRRQRPQRHRLAHRRHRPARADRHAPLARDWHHHILNHRALYGLPRKFNVAFDGGGTIACWRTPTTSASWRSRSRRASAIEAGIYFRLDLGGITGHKDFARDTGVLLEPDDATRRRRDRPRLHRARRPHRPQQGAAEICPRRLGLREVPGGGREEARPQLTRVPRAGVRAAPTVRPARPTSACIRRSSPA